MKSNKKVVTVKTTSSTIELDREDIINFLLQNGYLQKNIEFKSLDIFVRVPGGGDYSGCNLDIDSHCPVVVKIEQEEEK